MADTQPTRVTFLRAIELCVLLLVAPNKFSGEEDADNKLLSERRGPRQPEDGASVVRGAFWGSLRLVSTSGLVGGLAGVALSRLCGSPTPGVILALQLTGALVLLWGTVFVRGSEIDTWSGVTLTERVNRWLYRSLYWIGTATIVLSLVWPQFRQ